MENYTSKNLKVLKGLEAVRKRPGMYIGSTDSMGLHHLIWEIIDNAIDEHLSGYVKNISVIITNENSIIVEDNGRGIPIDKHSESNLTGVELIFKELHAGGKFGQNNSAYKVSGGLNGVGASVVNALSKKLVATVYKNNFIWETIFANGGEIIQTTKKIGSTTKKGTKIEFWPDFSIFKDAEFSKEIIEERIRETSFLNAQLKINFIDKRIKYSKFFHAKEGLKEYVDFINYSKKKLTDTYIFDKKIDDIEVEFAFQYTNDYFETIISFVNNIKTKNGGTHENAFKNAITKIFNDYANNVLEDKKIRLEGQDIREGFTGIIHVKIPENILAFVGQTKDSLRTIEAKIAVDFVVKEKLNFWLQENKNVVANIIEKAIQAQKARIAAKKARKDSRNVNQKLRTKSILGGKLTKAQSKDPMKRELFLVEGDSAGGSAKLGRDKKIQAILPLKGKVINAQKANFHDIIKNEEIITIINAIGAGIGKEFDITKCQYGKIIIMTDADTDGAHIQLLILTFLFKYMRPLIENKRVYIAQPPLYKFYKKTSKQVIEEYAWDYKEIKKLMRKTKNGLIQRYKGLGEMNAEQLWETTMDPKQRNLILVNLNDIFKIEHQVLILMGDKVSLRRDWINENVNFTLEDKIV